MGFAVLILAAALALPAGIAHAAPIEIASAPIPAFARLNADQRRFDRLVFLGGLTLRADAQDFGGFSGLRLSEDGTKLSAITDRGHWLSATLVDDGTGRPIRIEDADLAPIRGPEGRALPGTANADTEALEIVGRTAFITTERTHRLFRLSLDDDGRPNGRPNGGRAVALPPAVAKLKRNAGLEAIAVLPPGHPNGGAMLVVAEEGTGEGGDHPAWIVGAPGSLKPKGWAALSVKRRDGYAVTDLTALPDGRHFALLERRYRPPFSLSMRVRLIASDAVKPGAVLDGDLLIEANLAEEIDNMEGIAAHRATDGRTILTLISDDNFNALQRTILLRFAIAED